jgi:DNA polymerase sigma
MIGGISSYSLIIVVIAYMHLKKITEEKNPAIVFYGFLEFLHT